MAEESGPLTDFEGQVTWELSHGPSSGMFFGTLAIYSKRTDRKNLSGVKRTPDERPTLANDLVTLQRYTTTAITAWMRFFRTSAGYTRKWVGHLQISFFRAITIQSFAQQTSWTISMRSLTWDQALWKLYEHLSRKPHQRKIIECPTERPGFALISLELQPFFAVKYQN